MPSAAQSRDRRATSPRLPAPKWKSPPSTAPRLAYYRDTLFPTIEYKELAIACEVSSPPCDEWHV